MITTDAEQLNGSEGSYSRTLGIAVLAVTLGGSVFTAGWNWRSVSNLEAEREQYVRKDVQGQQLQNINDRLSELSRQMEQMRAELEHERGRRP